MVRVRNGIVKQSEEKTLGNCLLNPKELLLHADISNTMRYAQLSYTCVERNSYFGVN